MPNRLAHESSPYLLQHANNPVEWWPWGQAAFDEARRRDVPILLSIGYSTCYWCHVMERESFESSAVAEVMNRHLVCIKLDREERPDVDDIYMAATVIMRGQGGWPMNVFLEPGTLRPFWSGTYFPPEPRGGMPGFPQVVESIADAWRSRRAEVQEQASALAGAVREQFQEGSGSADIGPPQVSAAVEMLLRMYDRSTGGFGRAPKFPQPSFIELLLAVRGRSADPQTRDAIDQAVRGTLDAMAIGGIRDHVGGGFHRYAVDQSWTVPHFEKMLYDNAQLVDTYARASVEYADAEYARAASETVEYVLREMTGPEGVFYSAQDAEVDHREGLNYLWTPEQVRASGLSLADAELAIRVYSLARGPNFRDPHHPGDPPANVLRLEARVEEIARREGVPAPELIARMDAINRTLLAARASRKQPHLDDKVIVSWNAMMIAALARAGSLLGRPRWIDAAARAATRITDTMAGTGGLARVSRAGKPGATGAFLEDYAFLVQGLCAVARARPELGATMITRASGLARDAITRFSEQGKLFDAPAGAEDLFVRPSSTHDGAVPSGASAFIHAMIDLAELTGDPVWNRVAISALRSMSERIAESPAGCVNAVRALFRLLTTDPAAAAALAPAGSPKASVLPAPTESFTPVEIYADAERVTVTRDTPGVFSVVMRIAPGYHVIAAEPGDAGSGLIPFRVDVGGGSGLSVFADYPAGGAHATAGVPPPHPLVYAGEVEFKVVVERSGKLTGRPLLRAVFQACSDTECLRPTTVELDVAIDAVT